MPELPEVKTVVKHLNIHLKDKTILKVEILFDKLIREIEVKEFKEKLKNQKILNITNYGKFIVFELKDLILLSHLRMEGKYRISNKSNLEEHEHLVFYLDNNKYLFYKDVRKFGTFYLRRKDNWKIIKPIKDMGLDFEKLDINLSYKNCIKRNINIKNYLLDQTQFLGLGNIYVSEVLWHSKVHPLTICKNITFFKWKQIIKNAIQVLKEATLKNGTKIATFKALDEVESYYQNDLKAYFQTNKTCSRCQKGIIKKIMISNRGTYFCPICQVL